VKGNPRDKRGGDQFIGGCPTKNMVSIFLIRGGGGEYIMFEAGCEE